jgi:hypothetical protein
MDMEGQRERTSSRRRQRRKAKTARGKAVLEPVLIAARRPDSPLLKNGFRTVVASAQPKSIGVAASPSPQNHTQHALGAENGAAPALAELDAEPSEDFDVQTSPRADAGVTSRDSERHGSANGVSSSGASLGNGGLAHAAPDSAAHNGGSSEPAVVRRRAVRIVKVTDNVLAPGNREQQLLDRLVRSQGRGAISRAADDLWESKFVAPKRQEVQIQLLEHENEHRARDAVFIMAELLQRESPIKRPVLEQRLRRLETAAEDPITRDAAGALRRSMRVHHGL